MLDMYLARLGQHFAFQSAQRLVVARIEELSLHSRNTKWLMIIDKMDQQAAKLPTIWPLIRAPFFKEGVRLQVSLNGAWIFGPTHSDELLVRTTFEDCAHGSNVQTSTILNLHGRVFEGE